MNEPSPPSGQLQDLLKTMKILRDTPVDWMVKEAALLLFISQIDVSKERVLCKGDYIHPEAHYPAVLVYNVSKDAVEVCAAERNDSILRNLELKYFHSNIPHVGIAREVLIPDTEV